ncbi:MAG: hypothetical protein K5656_04490 [Lachnospiraceae bacterium]|nr:hypothetical protein [Lachnospiraceae bacterium]
MNQKTNIKYDLKFYKAVKATIIISFVLTVISALVFFAGANVKASDITDQLLIILLIITFLGYITIPLLVISLVLFLDSSIYLKRLKNNGFDLPDNKMDYQNDLSNLSRTNQTENIYANDSKHLFIIFLAVFFICLAFDIAYLLKWHQLVEDSVALFIFLILFHLLFLIAALIFLHQRDSSKYIDAVDIRDGRKVRMSITSGIALLLIMGLIAAFSISTAHSMTDYIHKSRTGNYDDVSYFYDSDNLYNRAI